MAVKLNDRGYQHATMLIREGSFVADERTDWSEHQPTTAQENHFIKQYGLEEYSRWHLGVDDDANPDTKGYYKFPYGNFSDVHRCGLLAAESRAGQRKYLDIERAAAHLHGMIDGAEAESRGHRHAH
jgi:hypothetical protein